MQMTLLEFPGLQRGENPPVLKLDTRFLAAQRVPLLHVVGQDDQPAALVDLVSFLAYFLRLLLTIHIWSFRLPDAPAEREPQRLPGETPGLPKPQTTLIDVDRLPNGQVVRVRLTRYRAPGAERGPLVMIHGYSASGTTFAHHAVRPNMVEHFCALGRDVWVLDLRTSSGMPTARHPWAFEDAALADLPAAFEYIHRTTGKKLDVFAHCMGAAMFSMAVLAPPRSGERFMREREALPGMIGGAVLSQIGPVIVMSPANIFRAYAMQYLRHYLPLANYEFRVPADDRGLQDQLIDRLLATLPYPEEEFDVENPPWPPWRRTAFVGTRHRMDALYGRDFSLADKDGMPLLSDKVLEYIDDLFGPLSIDTVSQTINFARMQMITDRAGRNEYILPQNMKRWSFPTLSIHGVENGLSDVATLARLDDVFRGRIETCAMPGFGHQDSLIGKDAGKVFLVVEKFLDRDRNG